MPSAVSDALTAPYTFSLPGAEAAEVQTFRSVHHPGTRGSAAVWERVLAGKVAVAVVGVFALVTVRALLGQPVVATLAVGGLVAGALVAYLARMQLERRVVEVRVAGGLVAVQTALDVLARRPARFAPALDVRRGAPITTLTLDHEVWELDEADWDDVPALLAALGEARKAAR